MYDDVLKRYKLVYCHFCTDPVSPERMHVCTTCGAVICEGVLLGGIGCIKAMSLIASLPFRCHVCVRQSKTRAIVPYELAASGIRHRAKLTWPLLLIPIKLVNITSPPLDVTVTACQAEYEHTPEDVSCKFYFNVIFHTKHSTQIVIKKVFMSGSRQKAMDETELSLLFLRRVRREDRPANLIAIVDTHSDTYSGQLQTSKKTGSYRTVRDVVKEWIGDTTIEEMKKSSKVARGWEEKVRLSGGGTPWVDITPKTRGGWRVLLLLACGSSITIGDQWNDMRGLLER